MVIYQETACTHTRKDIVLLEDRATVKAAFSDLRHAMAARYDTCRSNEHHRSTEPELQLLFKATKSLGTNEVTGIVARL